MALPPILLASANGRDELKSSGSARSAAAPPTSARLLPLCSVALATKDFSQRYRILASGDFGL